MSRRLPLVLTAALPLIACLDAPDEVLGSSQAALTVGNGTNLNGTNLNGTNLNGTNLNGTNLNGGDLNHTLLYARFANARREGLTGNKLDSVWLVGSEFWGTQGSSTFHGLDFNQAVFQGVRGDGSVVPLWIQGLTPPAAGNDVWRYMVRYQDPANGLWYPICVTNDLTPLAAVPVNGRWNYQFGTVGGGSKIDDPAVFTFACDQGAITKCIDMGYRPWATTASGLSLAAHHQSCTRVIRADYCGEGISYTQDGNRVNLYDAVGVQFDDQADWHLEAEWDESGARCFSSQNRYPETVPCYKNRVTNSCGQLDHFNTGALQMTETALKK